MLSELYNNFIFSPILNLTVFLYQGLPVKDFGWVVVVLTILMKAVLLPLEIKNLRSQKKLKDIQPEIEETQRKHKDDKEAQAKSLMEIYQREGINPFSGLSSLFIQLPILIAIYQVLNHFTNIFQGKGVETSLYNGLSMPEQINYQFLGIINLGQSDYWLALLVLIFQVYQMQQISGVGLFSKAKSKEEALGRNMNIIFAVMLASILVKLPAALSLYFLVSILISFVSQKFLIKSK